MSHEAVLIYIFSVRQQNKCDIVTWLHINQQSKKVARFVTFWKKVVTKLLDSQHWPAAFSSCGLYISMAAQKGHDTFHSYYFSWGPPIMLIQSWFSSTWLSTLSNLLIISSFIHLHVVLNLYDFLFCTEKILKKVSTVFAHIMKASLDWHQWHLDIFQNTLFLCSTEEWKSWIKKKKIESKIWFLHIFLSF